MYIKFKENEKNIFIGCRIYVSPSAEQLCTEHPYSRNFNFLLFAKDALVGGDAMTANAKAAELGKTIESADPKMIGSKEKAELLKHTALIYGTKDIKVQREHFVPLSMSIIALAKSSKLSASPIYVQYCPMKKSSWLSSEKSVKNPYYGSAMLTCGKVTETIN